MNLETHLEKQIKFSRRTFGPPRGVGGVIEHIKQEIIEVEEDPNDIYEWADVIILALDGAWRSGFTPKEIAFAIEDKQLINEGRDWPSWRDFDPNKAINHVRDND